VCDFSGSWSNFFHWCQFFDKLGSRGCGSGSNYAFLTLKERDIETGLDYFLARYYASAQGRFTSADSYGGRLTNPQTLNRYAYVLNNPLKYTDPTGHQAKEPLCDQRAYSGAS
jgi:RHS repeat-associated protein